jgi:hypothetical protein
MPQPTATTFWVYENHQGINNVVDSLDKVPPSLQDRAQAVLVTEEEAELLRQAQPSREDYNASETQVLDNGSEYASKLPPGITPDTMAGAGIFLLALVFLRRLAIYYGYKTFGRIASIAIFTMAIGVVWTFAGVVIKENAKSSQAQTEETQSSEQSPAP